MRIFKQGLDISDVDVLLALVVKTKLDVDQAKELLESLNKVSPLDSKRQRPQSNGTESLNKST